MKTLKLVFTNYIISYEVVWSFNKLRAALFASHDRLVCFKTVFACFVVGLRDPKHFIRMFR